MHPDFVRLVMNENIHQAAHIGELASIRTRNRAVIKTLRTLLDRGIAAGVFRSDIEPVELHMSISALCFYNVSNRYTFSKIFERDMTSSGRGRRASRSGGRHDRALDRGDPSRQSLSGSSSR